MTGRTIPETSNRSDWPRLVAQAANDARRRIIALEAAGGAGGTTLDLDGGDASGVSGSSFDFDGGGA